MSIQPLGFLDTSVFSAWFTLKMKDKVQDGILQLRELRDDQLEPTDCAILKDWKSARALLSRIRTSAAPYFKGRAPLLGKAWVEVLPPGAGTPWLADNSDYAEQHLRTRTCLIPAPGAVSHCGQAAAGLNVGLINLFDHKLLCSETNHGEHPRVHLIVDVKIPVDDPDT